MEVQKKLRNILERINVRDATKVAFDMCDTNNHMIYYKIYNKNYKLSGGGKDDNDNIKIEYEGEIFNFYKYTDRNVTVYNLYKENNKELLPECLIIHLDKALGIAYLNGISYDDKCFNMRSTQKSGTTLLKLSLKLIDKIKAHYNIKKITLTDNSRKYCGIGIPIEMWALSMLTTGNTWYGSHGFTPVNGTELDKLKLDKSKLEIYLENMEKVNSIKVKNTNIMKYFKEALKKTQKTISSDDMNELIEKYKNKSILIFFKNLLKNYDMTCDIFSLFYEKILRELGMGSLYGVIYEKLLS
jgi:hypothetical protein